MEKSRLNKKQKFGIYYLDENTNKTQKEIANIFNVSRQTINTYLQDKEMKKLIKEYFDYGFIYAMSNCDAEELFGYKKKQNQYYKVKCKTTNGDFIYVEVKPLDPIVAKTRIEKNPFILKYFSEIYENLGLIKYDRIGEARTWVVDAKKFCDVLIQLARLDITIYSTERNLKEKKLYPFEQIKEKIQI